MALEKTLDSGESLDSKEIRLVQSFPLLCHNGCKRQAATWPVSLFSVPELPTSVMGGGTTESTLSRPLRERRLGLRCSVPGLTLVLSVLLVFRLKTQHCLQIIAVSSLSGQLLLQNGGEMGGWESGKPVCVAKTAQPGSGAKPSMQLPPETPSVCASVCASSARHPFSLRFRLRLFRPTPLPSAPPTPPGQTAAASGRHAPP